MVKFLVIRFSSIGDIVLTSPVLRHLKKEVEEAEVHFLTKSEFAPLLEANPHVDRVHSFKNDFSETVRTLKQEGIDYIIDLHHNLRSAGFKLRLKRMDFTVRKMNWKKWLLVNFKMDRMPDLHLVDRYMDTIRMFIREPDDLGLDYFIPADKEVEMTTLPPAFRKGYIALSIGANHNTKKLPPESLIVLCSMLEHPVLILGGKGEKEAGDQIISALAGRQIVNGCGRYSIHQSASLVRQSSLLITHDTGLMHIGAAFGKTILTIWGNTVPKFGMSPYRPGPGSTGFEVNGLRCRPCSKIGYRECPKKHFKCMLDQDLDGIAGSANRLLRKSTIVQ